MPVSRQVEESSTIVSRWLVQKKLMVSPAKKTKFAGSGLGAADVGVLGGVLQTKKKIAFLIAIWEKVLFNFKFKRFEEFLLAQKAKPVKT